MKKKRGKEWPILKISNTFTYLDVYRKMPSCKAQENLLVGFSQSQYFWHLLLNRYFYLKTT